MTSHNRLYVIKRSGDKEPVYFDRITVRNQQLSNDLDIDPAIVSQKVIESIYPGIKTEELDILSAETALYMSTNDPQYEVLAKRIIISNLHKKTKRDFSKVTEFMYNLGILNPDYYNFVNENRDALDNIPDYDRDYNLSYFGFKTLEKTFLNKDTDNNTIERPQHMWLRVATYIRMPDLDKIKEVYNFMSEKYFTHASPTLFNSGLKSSQLSSCFLLSMNDKLEDMLDCMKYTGLISKHGGGIGINISMIRSKGSRINSTGGNSDGIIPFLKVWNSLARCINQSGKRKGSFAIYLEPHHPDIFDFLNIRKNNTKEEFQCLDLHQAIWMPDLFMKRLRDDDYWCLFDPNKVKNLHDMYGDEYEKVYLQAEQDKLYEKRIKAKDLWTEILITQMETGEPYILFKDHINRKSNQKNIGVIRGSNLCCEILEYTDNDTIAVCNLCSISLPAFVNIETKTFDYEKLSYVVKLLTENMNIVIDKNFYPVENAKKSNMNTRPTGIGVQGLADVFQMLELSWMDEKARELNKNIFAVIYYYALQKSMELSKELGPYDFFKGSPTSDGILQPDLWGVKPVDLDGMLDWDTLRSDIMKYGLRNSLLVSQMPTASTSQILGNNESIEPFTSNLYVRRVLSGDFPVINKHLYKTLKSMNLWNEENVNKIIKDKGSVLNLNIPDRVKEIYKTAWELPMKQMLLMSIDRGAYICQTQSLNCFMAEPTMDKLSSMFMYGWSNGIKTGMYYLRRRTKVDAIQFTIMEEKKYDSGDSKKKSQKVTPESRGVTKGFVCTDDICTMCTS